MYRRSSHASNSAGPLLAIGLVGLTLLLLLGDFLFPQQSSALRAKVVDIFTPVIDMVYKPAAMLQDLPGHVNELAHLRDENLALHKQISDLQIWAQTAQQTDEENRRLKELLKYKDEATLSFLAARVIGENTGSFSNSVIVTAGARDGVERDMVALDDGGVVGRVVEVGDWSSRILLLSDLNFRLPVMVEEARQRAIFTGQGHNSPKLIYVAQPAEVKPGMRVVTSGHGGIFPAGLPVGVVEAVKDGEISVTIFGHLDRLELVRLARYKLGGPEGATPPVEVISPPLAAPQPSIPHTVPPAGAQ